MSRKPTPLDGFIGDRMKQLRTTHGIALLDLAKSLNLSYQQVQKYENGVSRIPASRLYELAAILKVPITTFFPEGDLDYVETTGVSSKSMRLAKLFDALPSQQKKIVVKLLLEFKNEKSVVVQPSE